MRDVPIITFINKMDREARDPFELMDEIADTLALDTTPISWPVGSGLDFRGCYDVARDRMLVFGEGATGTRRETLACEGVNDPRLATLMAPGQQAKLAEDVELIQAACPAFDQDSYLAGHMTPLFFGSALKDFGVKRSAERRVGKGCFSRCRSRWPPLH